MTEVEKNELFRLLEIITDENKLSGQRRIAMAKFDHLFKKALKN